MDTSASAGRSIGIFIKLHKSKGIKDMAGPVPITHILLLMAAPATYVTVTE